MTGSTPSSIRFYGRQRQKANKNRKNKQRWNSFRSLWRPEGQQQKDVFVLYSVGYSGFA
jgi:hypothetical protein